ncbi:MAG TPA: carboxypeptidase-like regulatory domain-containing protein [Polyangiaceae bacterium]|jgi:hypothetical protein
MKRAAWLVAGLGIVCGNVLFSGCGSNPGGSADFTGGDGGTDATTDGASSSSSGSDSSFPTSDATSDQGVMSFGEGGLACPSTCTQLGANCGAATDTKCGGVVQCGTCEAGICGGSGTPNVCGGGSPMPDGCSPTTCISQNVTCGQTDDGCGNTLQCGTCNLPQSCGGNPATPGQCGCTGVCQSVPTCASGMTTTLTGTVLDPAGIHPLYNALVYIPNNPSDPGLQPFAPGITCDVCGSTAAGDPLVSTFTAPDGTFTLSGVPVGSSVLMVVQLGRWRRQFNVNIATSCGANAVPAGTLTMPKNHTEGDIPRIGVLTGGFDPIECVLRKMGVQDTEFNDPGGPGHIQFYLANQNNQPPDPFTVDPGSCPPNPYGSGAKIDTATPSQATLFGTSAGTPTINQYDMVILACEGYEENMQADWPNLGAYTSAGGRVFMTDYSYDWMAQTTSCTSAAQCGAGGKCTNGQCANPNNVTQNPAYPSVATWHTGQNPGGSPETGTIDLVSNPKGMAFEQWLQNVGVSTPGSGTVALNPVFHNSDSITAPTQQWLYWGSMTPIHFTFNTPVGAASANQCGRVVYSDWHADALGFSGSYPSCPYTYSKTAPYLSHGLTFPSECDSNPMTPQEAILEFMLFDLSACVQPYTPVCTPTSCMTQGIQCGPASDGCGNLLQCGSCPTGQTCGGGGAGKCGTTATCTPETCMSQGIQCGQAGDGCGNTIDCGNCAAGQICGLGGAGKCGTSQ